MAHLVEHRPTSPTEGGSAHSIGTGPEVAAGGAQRRGMSRGMILLLGVIATLVIGSVAVALHSRLTHEAELKRVAREGAVVSVNVVHPTSVAATDEITLPGSAQAYMDTPIYARTSGYLKSWSADIGTHVKSGQVLAEVETPEVDQQLEQALADLNNAQANLDLSQVTETRAEDLFKKNTISRQERDQAASDLVAKKALVASSQANVRRLRQLKAFENVLAPFDGVITARNIDVGALIQAGDNAGAKELFHLADNHMLRVYFSVPEVYASTVTNGEKVETTFDSFPGEKFTGTLVRNAAALDPHTHTLTVEADIENTSGRLFPGGYASVHLKFPPTKGAVSIPANTLLFRAEGTRIAVVRDSRVVLVPITIGRDSGNSIEVLGGISTEDAVVLDPPDSLTEGDVVSIASTSNAH